MYENLIAELRALAREIILNDDAIKSMFKACANEVVTQELEVPEKEYYSLSDLAEVLKVNA